MWIYLGSPRCILNGATDSIYPLVPEGWGVRSQLVQYYVDICSKPTLDKVLIAMSETQLGIIP